MLVSKQGIFRNIDEKKLPEYKEKGYKVVTKGQPNKDAKEKQTKGQPKVGG